MRRYIKKQLELLGFGSYSQENEEKILEVYQGKSLDFEPEKQNFD